MAEPRYLAGPHVVRFRATLAGLEGAANALRGLLDAANVDASPRYHVELAFDEIAGNIVRHGKPSGEVEVAVTFDKSEIALSFEDDGAPFDPLARPDTPAPSSIDEASDGGRGLMLVKRIAVCMAYRRTPEHRNHLTVTIATH